MKSLSTQPFLLPGLYLFFSCCLLAFPECTFSLLITRVLLLSRCPMLIRTFLMHTHHGHPACLESSELTDMPALIRRCWSPLSGVSWEWLQRGSLRDRIHLELLLSSHMVLQNQKKEDKYPQSLAFISFNSTLWTQCDQPPQAPTARTDFSLNHEAESSPGNLSYSGPASCHHDEKSFQKD